jgi:hypothetical protein
MSSCFPIACRSIYMWPLSYLEPSFQPRSCSMNENVTRDDIGLHLIGPRSFSRPLCCLAKSPKSAHAHWVVGKWELFRNDIALSKWFSFTNHPLKARSNDRLLHFNKILFSVRHDVTSFKWKAIEGVRRSFGVTQVLLRGSLWRHYVKTLANQMRATPWLPEPKFVLFINTRFHFQI